MPSIANNHLSEVARLGRHGDTELAHVNKAEKNLLESLGGSGTINPNTGLPEYWATAIALGSLAVGAYSAWKGGQTSRIEAGAQMGATKQGLEDVSTSEANLDKVAESQTNVARQEYDKGVRDLSAQTGMGIEDLKQNTQTQIQKSGMATPGSITGKSSQMWRRIQTQHQSGKGGLMATLGKKMGDITEMYEAEKQRLSGERKKFQREYDLAKEKEGSWYLGKTAEDVLSTGKFGKRVGWG